MRDEQWRTSRRGGRVVVVVVVVYLGEGDVDVQMDLFVWDSEEGVVKSNNPVKTFLFKGYIES